MQFSTSFGGQLSIHGRCWWCAILRPTESWQSSVLGLRWVLCATGLVPFFVEKLWGCVLVGLEAGLALYRPDGRRAGQRLAGSLPVVGGMVT